MMRPSGDIIWILYGACSRIARKRPSLNDCISESSLDIVICNSPRFVVSIPISTLAKDMAPDLQSTRIHNPTPPAPVKSAWLWLHETPIHQLDPIASRRIKNLRAADELPVFLLLC